MTPLENYPLGYSEAEAKRLIPSGPSLSADGLRPAGRLRT
jgi:hypothetical protein